MSYEATMKQTIVQLRNKQLIELRLLCNQLFKQLLKQAKKTQQETLFYHLIIEKARKSPTGDNICWNEGVSETRACDKWTTN